MSLCEIRSHVETRSLIGKFGRRYSKEGSNQDCHKIQIFYFGYCLVFLDALIARYFKLNKATISLRK